MSAGDGWSLGAVAAAARAATGAAGDDAAQHGVLRAGARVVRRLALALDERDANAARLATLDTDALFLHRPWRVPLGALGADVGALFSHAPFDDRLTTGWNPRLADALALRDVAPFGEREGRALAMVGACGDGDARSIAARVVAEFGGCDAQRPGDGRRVRRVAVAGAMTDALVREAAERGAALYVTGELRQPAAAAVRETGMHVLAVGHRRSERWGLHALARALAESLDGLRCDVLADPPPASAGAPPAPR